MLLDIHTHRNAAVPGECIFNVEPAWFEPVEGCYYSVGIHPWKVLEAGPEDWTTLEKAVCHPSVLAIGEAGLDRLGPADILLQKEVFVRQILLSESVGKPLVIHCVKAFNELIELKKKYRPQMPWVVHGFRNNLHIACRLMQENIYFSLGERYQPDVLRHVPLECLLAETDESTQDIRMVIGQVQPDKRERGVVLQSLRVMDLFHEDTPDVQHQDTLHRTGIFRDHLRERPERVRQPAHPDDTEHIPGTEFHP